MRARSWRTTGLTAGEKSLALAYVAVSIFGTVLAFWAVLRLGHGAAFIRGLTGFEVWTCISGGIGAGLGLYLSQHRFGQPGVGGTGRALGGMVMICFTGSLIAGTLALPFYGTMFGPFTLGVVLFSSPLLALCWASTLFGVHFLISGWRSERDSIFKLDRMHLRVRPERHRAISLRP